MGSAGEGSVAFTQHGRKYDEGGGKGAMYAARGGRTEQEGPRQPGAVLAVPWEVSRGGGQMDGKFWLQLTRREQTGLPQSLLGARWPLGAEG